MSWQILQGDVRARLEQLDDQSVQTCVTSPPYWGLRDYGTGQLGLEATPEEYVANMIAVFREVRRVLRDDGTLWLNLGDSFRGKQLAGIPWRVAFALQADGWWLRSDIIWNKPNPMPESVTDRPTRSHEYLFLLTKSARYFYDADAIREEGVWLGQERSDRGPRESLMPGTATHNGLRSETTTGSRNKRSVWTVTTQPYPDAHFATFPPKLIEPCILAGSPPKCCGACGAPWRRIRENREAVSTKDATGPATDEYAEVITAGTQAQRRSHGQSLAREPARMLGWTPTCACYERCCEGTGMEVFGDTLRHCTTCSTQPSTVLDPFAGSGTTGLVALRHDRSFVGIELNPDYCELARNRIRDDAPLLNAQLEAAA